MSSAAAPRPTPALNALLDSLIPVDDPDRVPEPDEVYLAFSEWAESTGRPLYPHQDEALSEILQERHVIAATPTGSGKSMIALAAHTASLARDARSYYTAPLKALVSEKKTSLFFSCIQVKIEAKTRADIPESSLRTKIQQNAAGLNRAK